LITGTAGFIGFHVAKRLLRDGHEVVGLDGMTSYYNVEYKRRRHAMLLQSASFSAHEVMLEDAEDVARVWDEAEPDVVIHLAAQAGVRYSLENPGSYIASNVVGTFNILENARRTGLKHLLLASTSSVYGGNEEMPFSERHRTDHPMTIYAATKKSTELMAHSYAHLFDIPTTAFRFFTVYGPWGRPDMALFKFVSAIFDDKPIELYNAGKMERDFTYIDDLVEGIVRLVDTPPSERGEIPLESDSISPVAPFRVVNIGSENPVALLDFVEAIEAATGRKAIRIDREMQPGDVPRTYADASLLAELTAYRPATPISTGIAEFVAWYRDYHQV
jgi:UDP-glucuronate 4-epimerase